MKETPRLDASFEEALLEAFGPRASEFSEPLKSCLRTLYMRGYEMAARREDEKEKEQHAWVSQDGKNRIVHEMVHALQEFRPSNWRRRYNR